MELSRIAKAINMDTKTTEKLIHNMMDRYEQEERGIQIIELGDSYQMCTRKKYYEYLINIALHPQKPVLTEVMLETLSIIAYKQPVTKAELEKIRGNWEDWMHRESRFSLEPQRSFCEASEYRIWMNCLCRIRSR